MIRYNVDEGDGWVVIEDGREFSSGKPYTAYWCGPDRTFGTTYYTSLQYGVAVFATKKAAETAYRSVYGRMRKSVGAKAIRLSERDE